MSFYIVPTPIGNLKDISNRSIQILSDSDIILCEKKERALKLLNSYSIKPKLLIPYHDDKCEKIAPRLVKELTNNKVISLISDAGTPLISDPGHKIIRFLVENKIEPITVPGPSSVISALTLSTLDISNFLFLGFLPKNKSKMVDILKEKLPINIPLVIFSNTKEVTTIINILNNEFRNTFISISKEISKINEGTKRGTPDELIDIIQDDFFTKGEFIITLVNTLKDSDKTYLKEISILLNSFKNEGITLKQSVKILKNHFKINKKIIYDEALKIWDKK
ncbi:rRNA small subunit methyltransferase 1 [bacterium]|nr:rRNA small subunit methyltransferase 1 [bacterium]